MEENLKFQNIFLKKVSVKLLVPCKDFDFVVSFGNRDSASSSNAADSSVVHAEHLLEEITKGGNRCYGDDF